MLGDPILANIGLPMVAVYLPPAWLALVPIILSNLATARGDTSSPSGAHSLPNLSQIVYPVDDRDGAGWTPLFNAALKADRDILEALLSAGADVNARTSTGWTALREAQLRGHKNIADRLIQAGAIDYPNGSRQ